MDEKPTERSPTPTLAALYPALTPAELEEAAARLDEYLAVVFEIAEDVEHDPALQREFDTLTRMRAETRMKRSRPEPR